MNGLVSPAVKDSVDFITRRDWDSCVGWNKLLRLLEQALRRSGK